MSVYYVSKMTQAVLLPALLLLCQLSDGLLLAAVPFQLLGPDPHGSVEIKPWDGRSLKFILTGRYLQGEHSAFEGYFFL